MNVYRDLVDLPSFTDTIITIGSFDGLHGGHQKIITQVKRLSRERQCENVVITFHPHPRHIIYPKDDSLKLLTTLEEKIDLFRKAGVDNLVLVNFTVEFSQQSADEYIRSFLLKKFHPQCIVIGYDHRFGLNRSGDIQMLKLKSKELGYEVVEIPKQQIDDIAISSTKVRKALGDGKLDIVNTLLNRPYHLSGVVIRGRKLGTEIGFPTANLKLLSKYKLVPKLGIYVVHVIVRGKKYQGMLYIGDLPTVGLESKRSIEVNIFDFDEDIYDDLVEVHLLKYLRGDEEFSSIENLRAQLIQDREASINYFSGVEMNEDLDTSIVILNYNTVHHLESFLPSVGFSSQKNFDTVVIDNNSNDGSADYIAEWHPEIKVVSLDSNYGFAGGYNKGLESVDSKYIILLNSDVRVEKDWIDPLIEFMDTHPDYAAVMPKVRSMEDPQLFEYAGAAGGFIDVFGYPFCKGRVLDTLESDEGQYDQITDIFWVTGAAAVFRRDLFEKFGGFDEAYFAHHEEIDLCWRLHNAGYKMAMIPSSIVYHLGGGTLSYGSRNKIFLNFRNSLSSVVKNEKLGKLFFAIPSRLVLDGLAGIRFLVLGQVGSCWAIIKAHFSFYARVPSLIRKRNSNKKLVTDFAIGNPNDKVRTGKSLIFEYYLRGKKKYSEIFNSEGH